MKKLLLSYLIVYFCKYEAQSSKLPGPLVYVVTPSPRPLLTDEGRSAPFYYHNWMRRMDPPRNATTTQTPDLIFAEFESGNKMKSIRKLLEKEKIESTTTTTTTARPIYVPDETQSMSQEVNYGLPPPKNEAEKLTTPDMTDYFALYNNMYNVDSGPVYMPSTTPRLTTSKSTTTTTQAPEEVTSAQVPNVQNIWHIIDSQKHDEYSGKWEEVTNYEKDETTETPQETDKTEEGAVDDNFALPGFGTNPGNGAENESRAIRTEQNIRFPYVNLKPFQMKTQKKPLLNTISSSKKGNNMYTSLDNFYDIKNPVRGEAQDVPKVRQPIDRYNPAQPYLPQPSYGSKQSSSSMTPSRAVANLVPPPPPPPPSVSDGDFPAPMSYDSFPPYPTGPQSAPAPPPGQLKPSMSFQSSDDSFDDSGPDSPDSNGPPDVSYRYKPPSPPSQPFLPTLSPLTKPLGGYSYDKPPIMFSPPGGSSYDKPSMMPESLSGGGYSYKKPQIMLDSLPESGYSYNKPPTADLSPDNDKPDFQGYQYSKPEYSAPSQDSAPSYGPGPDHSYGHDYPELIYDKLHGMKGEDDIKDAGMAPPPPPPGMKPDLVHGPPADDHGFPPDFHGGDLKFTHDFDDHDFHYHHHHPTTTTTTTESPRVNRYSYYYLGKKLYYLPLYFSVYFIIYVGALIIKAVLRHKIVYPNSWRPNDQTAGFFSKRSVDSYDFSNENLHEMTGKVTHAIAEAGKKYFSQKKKN